MTYDVFLELGVEKVRKDFGDFTGTLFQLVSHTKNCTIQEINTLVPDASYYFVRSTLFMLYQHNLISIKIFCSINVFSESFIENLKFLPNIHQAIYRLRYPRFLAFSEYEFGVIGKRLVEKLLKKGQMPCKNLLKEEKNDKSFYCKEAEDILIQLGRDGLIKCAFFWFKEEKRILSFSKPIVGDDLVPWKICVSHFNSNLKINLIINLLQDSVFSIFKTLLKASFSRIFGFKSQKLAFQWFSIDTLEDFLSSIKRKKKCMKENQLTQLFENQLQSGLFLEVRQIFYRVNYQKLFSNFQKILLENIIKNKYGIKFLKIFKILVNWRNINEENLIEECVMEELEVRKILFEMFRVGFVFLEERSLKKRFVSQSAHFFWSINYERVKKNFFFEIVKSIFFVLLKLEKLNFSFREAWIGKNFSPEVKKFFPSFSHFFFLYDILVLSLSRLDEVLIFFY